MCLMTSSASQTIAKAVETCRFAVYFFKKIWSYLVPFWAMCTTPVISRLEYCNVQLAAFLHGHLNCKCGSFGLQKSLHYTTTCLASVIASCCSQSSRYWCLPIEQPLVLHLCPPNYIHFIKSILLPQVWSISKWIKSLFQNIRIHCTSMVEWSFPLYPNSIY